MTETNREHTPQGENTETLILPSWLSTGERYVPCRDSDGYIAKTLLSLISILSRFRQAHINKQHGNAAIALGSVLITILLVSLSRNFYFTLFILAFLLIRLCILDAARLKAAITPALTAAAFTAIVMIPSVFLTKGASLLTLTAKVFTCTGLLGLISITVRWNHLTEGLRFYRIPGIFIFTLDITLKFIALLGQTALETMHSLQLRSVGKNMEKSSSFGGVLGMTFLHAKSLSEEMYGAMQLRGFDGEYKIPARFRFDRCDALTLLGLACAIAVYIILHV